MRNKTERKTRKKQLKDKMLYLNNKIIWAADMTQEKADAEIKEAEEEIERINQEENKTVVYPEPTKELHEEDFDLTEFKKEDMVKFYKANRVLYTRRAERVRSDLFYQEFAELLNHSINND